MEALTDWSPLTAARAITGDDVALRLLPVMSDNMEPKLRIGRHMVVVREVAGYEGEGMYVDRHDAIHMVERRFGRDASLSVFSFNKVYGDGHLLTDGEFANGVAGKVVAAIEVLDHESCNRLYGAASAMRRSTAQYERSDAHAMAAE